MVFIILIIGLVVAYSYFGILGVGIPILAFLIFAYFLGKKDTLKTDFNVTINFDDNIDYEQLIIDSLNGESSYINKKIRFGGNAFEISPNSRYIAVDNPISNSDGSEKSHTIDIYEIHTSTLIRKFEIKDRYYYIKSMNFCPNAKYLLASTSEELLFYDLNTSLIVKKLNISNYVNSDNKEAKIIKAEFSQKGNYLIVHLENSDYDIRVIDINNGSMVKKIKNTNFFHITSDDKYFIYYLDEVGFDSYILKERIYGEIEQKFIVYQHLNGITDDLNFFFGVDHLRISIYDTANVANYKSFNPKFSIEINHESYIFRNAFCSKCGSYLIIRGSSRSIYKVFVLDIKNKTIIGNGNWSFDKIGLIQYLNQSSKGRFLIHSVRYNEGYNIYFKLGIQKIY